MDNPANDLYQGQALPIFLPNEVALLCIDLQYHDAAPGFGFFKDTPIEAPEFSYYFNRLNQQVFPNVRRLQDALRSQKQEVIHARIEALTQDGRDRGSAHKRIGCLVPKGSKAAEFMPEVAPKGDEIIVSKTASGVFNSTNIEYVLNNLGIKQLIVVGVLTNECVDTTVRDAADRGFTAVVVEDATAAFTEQLHQASLTSLHGAYATVASTDAVIENLNNMDGFV